MAPDNSRIAELRRRVEADPGSIAFAQLAEECRRAGEYHEAIAHCRRGLTRHPAYLSARVTLGRALFDAGLLDEAASEFERVLQGAPDNLAAIRGLADIHERRGALDAALGYYKRALSLARFDPRLEATVTRIDRALAGGEIPAAEPAAAEIAAGELGGPENARGERAAGEDPAAAVDAPATRAQVDFDALLASMGAADAAPPPATDRLLAGDAPEPPAPMEGAAPLAPERPDDPFAQLEAGLRAIEQKTRRPGDDVLEALEAWLRALVAARQSSGHL